jgi:hypothetical protein
MKAVVPFEKQDILNPSYDSVRKLTSDMNIVLYGITSFSGYALLDATAAKDFDTK